MSAFLPKPLRQFDLAEVLYALRDQHRTPAQPTSPAPLMADTSRPPERSNDFS